MESDFAEDVKRKIEEIVLKLCLKHIDLKRIVCMRSYGSKSNASARIWSMPRIWQKALNIQSYYVIEVISQHYDKLSEEEKEKTLLHELMHVPKTFSGALVPHTCFGRKINRKSVEELFKKYKEFS